MIQKLFYGLIFLFLLFILPSNTFAQDSAYEDYSWDVDVGLGVGLYHIIPEPDIEISASYRLIDFYHLGLQFNCLYIHHIGKHTLSEKFQYQVLILNTFDFYRGRNVTWSAKVGLGYMYLMYSIFHGDDDGNVDKTPLHSFSTLVSIVLDYQLTDLFSLGFSMPLTINFNKEHRYWGGFNLLFNMGFHFG